MELTGDRLEQSGGSDITHRRGDQRGVRERK
jgi:hypothetical protein